MQTRKTKDSDEDDGAFARVIETMVDETDQARQDARTGGRRFEETPEPKPKS